ncbi:hypothetical protein, partial [Phyllobacterium bourgognense]|uniref:hypothetical protein n=1 Tax=Phyllobacterium bourgognense TaxID=314236 RepID=UPI001AECC766
VLPHFRTAPEAAPHGKDGHRIAQVRGAWISGHDYFGLEVDRGALKAGDLPDGNAAVRPSTGSG